VRFLNRALTFSAVPDKPGWTMAGVTVDAGIFDKLVGFCLSGCFSKGASISPRSRKQHNTWPLKRGKLKQPDKQE